MKSFWIADRNRSEVDTRTPPRVRELLANLREPREALLNHPIYTSVDSEEELHTFMSYHIYAVWDFMSLLKSLQQQMSCVSVPWVPVGNKHLRRLINEIVVSEETDEDGLGGYGSHFELYLDAMDQCGADKKVIEQVIEGVRSGRTARSSLASAGAPMGAQQFCDNTFRVIETGSVAAVATAFALSREDVVPLMFQQIVDDLRLKEMDGYDRFIYYLDRHIAVDADTHGPMAFEMIDQLCGDDPAKWAEAEKAARITIESRTRLWDGAYKAILARKPGNDASYAA